METAGLVSLFLARNGVTGPMHRIEQILGVKEDQRNTKWRVINFRFKTQVEIVAAIVLQGDRNKMSQNKKKIVYSAKEELEVRHKVHSRGDVRVQMWCNLHCEWLI